MKATSHLLISLMLILSINAYAQNVAISDGASAPTPDASAVLDLQSATKGFLPPRVYDFSEISSPAAGLMVFLGDTYSSYSPGPYYYNGMSWIKYGSASDATQWTTSGSDIYYNSGNVGIGTAGPYGKLDVRGGMITQTTTDFSLNSAGTAIGFSLGSQTGNTYGKITVGTTGDMVHGNLALLPGGGNVGIGVTNPIYPLQVDSYKEIENQAGYYFSASSGAITANSGNWHVGIYSVNSILTNGAFVAFSDLRIKENIKEIQHSLDLIGKLRPVSYNKTNKIENGGRTEFGFIAQEVEKILPEAVNTGTGEIPVLKPFDKVEFEDGVSYTILVKNGDNIVEQKYTTKDPRPEGEIIVKSKTVDDFKSLSYDMIFTVAVDAIREQQAQIEAQQGQLEAQQAQLASQQAQIDALKAQNAVLTQKAESFDQLKAEVENLKKLVNSNLSQLTINQ